MANKLYDVIIAGAGPVGLFLACELGLARVSVLVLERDFEAESPWKVTPLGMRGVNTPTVEAFYRRGLYDKIFGSGKRPPLFEKTSGFQFGGHFAGLPVNANKLDLSRWKYCINGPALQPGPTMINRVEAALTERAKSLGVTILGDHGVTGILAQDGNSVTVEAGERQSFRGKWLVGCDGGRSVVRKAAGFDFVGTEATFTGYAVHCDWEYPEKLKPGFHMGKGGMYIIGGATALYLADFDSGTFDRNQQITREHVQSVFSRVSGNSDWKIKKVHLAASFTDRCKQAASYRKGRVLLAGDAAHIHGPVGSQGLNLGLGDAINLGWKLAATVQRESSHGGTPPDLTLLDTYESERHPIGNQVLEWVRTQVATMRPDPYSTAARALIRDFIDTTDGANLFMERHWGFTQRYNLGEGGSSAHPLVGSSMPDFELNDGTRLGPKLEKGLGLLVDFKDDGAVKELVVGGKYEARVQYIGTGAKDTRDLRALLVRPDGVVAWVSELHVKPNVDEAKAALERWFGS